MTREHSCQLFHALRCLPPSAEHCDNTLTAANGSKIGTYGYHPLTLDLGFARLFKWEFIIADVAFPILGADFLRARCLLVDLRGRRLLWTEDLALSASLMPADGVITAGLVPSRKASPWELLLGRFRPLQTPEFHASTPVKHSIRHVIQTSGQPCHAKACCLSPAKMNTTKEYFDRLLRLGIVRRSKSAFASPLHMAPKKDGMWHPCGDYRKLNEQTVPDRYPLPHIQDAIRDLDDCHIFSKIDLEGLSPNSDGRGGYHEDGHYHAIWFVPSTSGHHLAFATPARHFSIS